MRSSSLKSLVLVDDVLDDLVHAVLPHLPVQELDLDLQRRRFRLFGVSLHEEFEAELDVSFLGLLLFALAAAAALVGVHRLNAALFLHSASLCGRLTRSGRFLFLENSNTRQLRLSVVRCMYRCYRRRQRETTETQPEVRACGKRESQNPWRRTFVEPCTRSRDLCELRHRLACTQGPLTEFNEFTFNLSSSTLFCSLRFLRWFFQPREKVLAVNVVLSSVSLPGFTENCAAASHSEIRWNVVLQSSPAGT